MSKDVALQKKDCTEQQRKFLDYLHDEEIMKLPAKTRFRACADAAGYSPVTPMSQIMKPIQHLIIAEAEAILARASIGAAWALSNIVDGDEIDTLKDRLRMDAAKQVLDRTIAPKSESKGHSAAQVVIMLPPKSVAKIVDHVEEDV